MKIAAVIIMYIGALTMFAAIVLMVLTEIDGD